MQRVHLIAVTIGLLAPIALGGCAGEGTAPEAGISKDEASRLGATDDGVDYCARYGWYADSACDDFCPLPDPDCGDEMAARCQAVDGSSTDAERSECCDIADYPYCGTLVSQDGEGPSLCIGVRGNGQRITSHFGALARLYEHYGLFDGAAGGSSASITTFLVDSVQMNPAVRCDGCTPHEQGGRAALLFKSLQGYFTVLAGSEEGLAVQTLARVAGEAQAGGVNSLLESGDPTSGVTALLGVLQSPEIQPLINPELLGLLQTSPDPVFHARDIMGALQNAANFDASDPTIFVRPGVLNFEVLAHRFGRIGSFYAGYAPVNTADMAYFLDECAQPTRGMTWTEAEAVATRDGATCGEVFSELAANFRSTLLADESSYATRADDTVGDTLPVLISTGVLEGNAIATWSAARAAYNNGEAIEWETNFDDVRLGYFGHSEDIARVMANPLGYDDLKTQKRRVLEALTWGQVLSLSPAEPGLARGLEIPGDERISVGGWSDLQPVLALRNMGCEKVIYVTRRGQRSGFFSGVTGLLGIDQAETSALVDLAGDSSFRLSLEEAAGVWCTDWDVPAETDLEAMYADGYNAPFETTDSYFSAIDGYDGVTASTGLAGCTAGQD